MTTKTKTNTKTTHTDTAGLAEMTGRAAGRALFACLVSVTLASLVLAACSSHDASDHGGGSLSRYLDQVRRTVDELSARQDSPALFTAALLAEVGARFGTATVAATHGAPESVILARRAVAAAPDDVLDAWNYLSLCAHSPECDTREAAQSYRQKDPGNALGWIYDLNEAERAHDDPAVDRILIEMARDRVADTHYTATVIRFVDTLGSLRADIAQDWGSEGTRGVTAIGLVGSNLPTFGPLMRSCTAPGTSAGRRPPCLAIAALLERADTTGPQSVGYRLALRLLAPGSAGYTQTQAEQRRFTWVQAQAASLSDQPRWWLLHSDLDHIVALLRAHDREEDVIRAQLAARHVPASPPADWVPPMER